MDMGQACRVVAWKRAAGRGGMGTPSLELGALRTQITALLVGFCRWSVFIVF